MDTDLRVICLWTQISGKKVENKPRIFKLHTEGIIIIDVYMSVNLSNMTMVINDTAPV